MLSITLRKVVTRTVFRQRLFLHNSAVFAKEALPYHLVVGLPALSPTMDRGTLGEWYVKEGDKFSAGDGLAKIETDKAAVR
jgi:pyruvate dehydrogenase E2 component (dihydrolipoamide acetyltransferase)